MSLENSDERPDVFTHTHELHGSLIKALENKDPEFARELIDQIHRAEGKDLRLFAQGLRFSPGHLAMFLEMLSDKEFELIAEDISRDPEDNTFL